MPQEIPPHQLTHNMELTGVCAADALIMAHAAARRRLGPHLFFNPVKILCTLS